MKYLTVIIFAVLICVYEYSEIETDNKHIGKNLTSDINKLSSDPLIKFSNHILSSFDQSLFTIANEFSGRKDNSSQKRDHNSEYQINTNQKVFITMGIHLRNTFLIYE